MHWHYHELLPSLPYFFSLRLYASLVFKIKGVGRWGVVAFFNEKNCLNFQPANSSFR